MLRALSLAVLLSVLAPAVAEAACPGTPNDCPSPTLNNLTVGGDITIGGSITGAGLSASDVTAADGTTGRTARRPRQRSRLLRAGDRRQMRRHD